MWLAPVIAKLGLALLSEAVVRRVALITIRALEARCPNQYVKELLDTIGDAWEADKK
jgi:hypothetical protein